MKIVWFSEIKWTYLTTRKQQIIRQFPDDWEVLFIESFAVGKKNGFLPKRDGRVTYATVPFFKATPYALVNRFQGFVIIRFLMTLAAMLWVNFLCRVTGFNGVDRVICTSNIFYAYIIQRMKKRLTVYDCNDYPLGFSDTLSMAPAYYKKTLAIADIVVTVSKRIADIIAKDSAKQVFLIGNGVDYELFDQTKTENPPQEMAAMPHPIILYSGAISNWFDIDLLLLLSSVLPNASLVLVGPILSQSVRTKLNDKLPANVHWLGEKKYTELPRYVHSADVCIIPFLKNDLTSGLNPNKLYEYLACGKPIVVMDYSDEIISLSSHIFVATTRDEFIAKTTEALNSNINTDSLRTIARENSWKKKSEAFAKLIQDRLA